MVLIQSTGVVPPMAVIITGYIVNFLLAVALAGLAFGVKVAAIHDNGWRPLALAAIATILISVSSLAAILLSGM
ncbi:hypothetical protein ACN2CC_02270 [Mesorhizobium muleiense]|uniref:hypothetical protein n=2 Tax=Mesorhizobium TaxID=68287 RepID=UPI000FE9C87D|nr:MAG: hypothetical protein EOQ33_29720 [Mesorhizobium sp.]